MKKYISTIVIVLGIILIPSFSFASDIFSFGTQANTHIFRSTAGSSIYPIFTIASSTVPSPISTFTLGRIRFRTPDISMTYRKILLKINGVEQWGWNTISNQEALTDFYYADYNGSSTVIHPLDRVEILLQVQSTGYGSGGPVELYATNSGTETYNSPGWAGDFSSLGVWVSFHNDSYGASGSWSPDYDFSFSTTTPGFVSNTSTTADWLHEIWDSSSTSAFALDCSGYSGGLFTSSTMGAIGCYAQKIPLGIMGMLISPLPQATNYISESFANIKNVFPFSMVFSAQNILENSIASSMSGSANSLSFPTNTVFGTITVLSSSTLENAIGSSTKAQVFGAIEFLIWLGAGIIIITLI